MKFVLRGYLYVHSANTAFISEWIIALLGVDINAARNSRGP